MHTFIHKAIPCVLLYCKIHDFIPWFDVLFGKYAQISSPADFDHFAVRIRISNAVVY